MKKLLRLGGLISLILFVFKISQVILPGKLDYLFDLLPISNKTFIMFLLNLLFFFILKKHANYKYSVYSEELKFIALILIMFLSQILKFLNVFIKGNIFLAYILSIILIFSLLFLEANIYYSLKNKVKDRNYKINMYIFIVAFYGKLIYILSNYAMILTLEFLKNKNLMYYLENLNIYSYLLSTWIYAVSYFFIAFIFFKPRERFSF